jgi:hypothetical protein
MVIVWVYTKFVPMLMVFFFAIQRISENVNDWLF